MNNASRLNDLLASSYRTYDLDVGAENQVVLTVIDDAFDGLSNEQRRAPIIEAISSCDMRPGLLELYTRSEASERGVEVLPRGPQPRPARWDDALSAYVVDSDSNASLSPAPKPRRIVFYSYKGGVGRTTALVHTAVFLSRAGKRVVIVDMDVEAPGIHTVLPPPNDEAIQAGIVDYLWERQVRPKPGIGETYETSLTDARSGSKPVVYAVEDPVSRTRIHVVPAGRVSSDYLIRLATISSGSLLDGGDESWEDFENELNEQIEPDFILIDARTGFSEWGALSVLRMAHAVFLVMYPSAQNAEGIRVVAQALRDVGGIPTFSVLSPVPAGEIGRILVQRFKERMLHDRGSDSEWPEEDWQPIEVQYNPAIAVSERLPVESSIATYAGISNQILETETAVRVIASIGEVDRWEVIRSLKFPERDATAINTEEFRDFFQKTSDFDRVLDDALWVVRGRKGTGKSTLYHLFTEHHRYAKVHSRGRLENVQVVSAHGPARGSYFRPTTDIFGDIHARLEDADGDWLSLWRAYAVVRLWITQRALVKKCLRRKDAKPLEKALASVFAKDPSDWRSSHTDGLLQLAVTPLSGLCRDLLIDIDRTLRTDGKKLWLLYDDLDQDIREDAAWQSEAIGGLLRLVYDSNNSDLHCIRFKVFLRDDIWKRLVFTNKSHFGDARALELRWELADFLRLAYRLAIKGSREFQALSNREFALPEDAIDDASEEDLRKALAPLWGLNQERGKKAFAARWVYSRMTDAAGNTYPRSLTVMLKRARDAELSKKGSGSAPEDRLLSPSSMQAGLQEASQERVDALKNEYPELSSFIDYVKKDDVLASLFSANELRVIWEQTSRDMFPTFELFVERLSNEGVLEKQKGDKFDYGFASLYIDGLGVKRAPGQKK